MNLFIINSSATVPPNTNGSVTCKFAFGSTGVACACSENCFSACSFGALFFQPSEHRLPRKHRELTLSKNVATYNTLTQSRGNTFEMRKTVSSNFHKRLCSWGRGMGRPNVFVKVIWALGWLGAQNAPRFLREIPGLPQASIFMNVHLAISWRPTICRNGKTITTRDCVLSEITFLFF